MAEITIRISDKALRIVGVFAVLHFGRIAPREDLSEKMTRVVQM